MLKCPKCNSDDKQWLALSFCGEGRDNYWLLDADIWSNLGPCANPSGLCRFLGNFTSLGGHRLLGSPPCSSQDLLANNLVPESLRSTARM